MTTMVFPHTPAAPAGQDASKLAQSLQGAGFRGEVETDTALLAAMATDNSVYQIRPDIVIAPMDAADVVTLMNVLERPEFMHIPLTARGGGTGTNGQSLNSGIILDMRRHMHSVLDLDVDQQWVEVEPGIVLDDLNAQLRAHGLFFAPETSTSTRCTLGGMVSTDASGKGSRIYGKTSDNLLGVEIANANGLLSSFAPVPDWAQPMLAAAERAARAGRDAFVANTPRLNRRFTGYDLERACPAQGGFEWWRLFPGSEGTLGPITRLRLKLRLIEPEKRLIVAAFASFRDALAAAVPLLDDDPTAIEVMDERVQKLAQAGGLLDGLPLALRPGTAADLAYTFVEFNGADAPEMDRRIAACRARLQGLEGIRGVHVAAVDRAEISALWAIRSAGVGLLGKVDGRARPVAFVEDCVVPPEVLPQFLDGFLRILTRHGLTFGIYGHVDVGCLHIRPALDIDAEAGRATLVAVSDEIFDLVTAHGGIFWGEHGKGVRGAYLADWIGADAYRALQGVKAAFDPHERFNPGKLVALDGKVMGIATTPFRRFNTEPGDPLEKAFRCNGNAQCLSYDAAVPMCPSFKATGDLRHSPKGRADALRAWHEDRRRGDAYVAEADLLGVLDTCLGCRACASSCPVQVDIPQMRAAFYTEYHKRHRRSFEDRAVLLAERLSPSMARAAPLLRPFWPLARRIGARLMRMRDLPGHIARPVPRRYRLSLRDLAHARLADNAVLIWQDWFSALFDEQARRDVTRGLIALGYAPYFAPMLPSGKVAEDAGEPRALQRLAPRLERALQIAASRGVPMIGLDPAYVLALRQRMRNGPELLLVQEFLAREIAGGRTLPAVTHDADPVTLFTHCTESTAIATSRQDWQTVFGALGIALRTPATGCCGMAGLFGHKERHQQMSRRLFDMSWADPIEAAPGAVAATGFSCRCQGARLARQDMRHPLGVIADHLAGSEAARPHSGKAKG